MGVSRWLLLLLLCHAGLAQASDLRFLRHSGRRDLGGGLQSPGLNATTKPPSSFSSSSSSDDDDDDDDLLFFFEDEGDASLGLEEVLVVRGQEVVLECEVPDRAEPIPGDDSVEGEVRWFHDHTQVLGDLRVGIMWTGRLVMSHAVSADSGVWWCHRSGRPGPRRRLLVTIPPERPYLMYGGAQLAVGARLTTREGNAITLHCVVEGGNPAPSIAWLLAAEDVTHLSQVRTEWRESEGVFYSLSNLTVARLGKEQHNATVACVVRHPALPVPIPVPLRLNIEYAPNFRLRRWPAWGSPVREGSSVSLLCHVDANPPSSPTWVKETESGSTEVASSGGWVNLTHVTSDDRGWYKCATSHSFGHFASHSVLINVLSEGRTAGVASYTPQLLRKTTTVSDSSRFRCVVHNTSLEFPGATQGTPVLVETQNSTVLSMGGRTTALAAQVCGHPPPTTVTWLPPDYLPPLRPGFSTGRFYAHNLTAGDAHGCLYTVLTIVGVRASDAGSWVVVGASDRGADAALIRLNVTAAAHSVAASSAAHRPAHFPTHTLLTRLFLLFLFLLPA